MSDERDRLERVAASVAEATPVDWGAESDRSPDLEPALRRLRQLEGIASAFRASGGGGPLGATWDRDIAAPAAPSPAAPAAVAESALFRWGHLIALEKRGVGSYGEVYRARDTVLDREVALKLRPARTGGAGEAAARRFLDEARRLARVRHPNVLVVHGADEHDGRVGLWCDLVRGRTLEERLALDGPFGAQEALVVGIELCRALAAVHAAGLVHGDVKASNVMRDERGAIVLLDFGAGRDQAAGSGIAAPDAPPISGTPLTLAPEVLRGHAPDQAADLYALGTLLYRLVSGRYPVVARSLPELVAAHERGDSVPLRDLRPDLPSPFVRAVERALAHDPAARYASAGAMERALSEALAGVPPSTADAAPGTAAAAPSGARTAAARRHSAWILIAALILGIGAVYAARRFAPPAGGGRDAAVEPAAAPVVPMGVQATLLRAGDTGGEPLASGSEVQPGDQLYLEIEGSVPLHVYVLDEDARGEMTVLFPIPGISLANPLAARARHRLPGTIDGISQDWRVTSAGGRETILIVASRDPLAPLEARIAGVPAARPGAGDDGGGAAGAIDPAALEGLRGIAGVAPSRPVDAAPGGRLAALAADITGRATEESGIWARSIELRNPLR